MASINWTVGASASPSVNYMNPMHTLVPVGTASNCPVDGSHLGSTERNHVFLRDMIRPAVASYHMTGETFTGGSVARGRNHVIFLSSGLTVLRPFVQLEAVLCTVIC